MNTRIIRVRKTRVMIAQEITEWTNSPPWESAILRRLSTATLRTIAQRLRPEWEEHLTIRP